MSILDKLIQVTSAALHAEWEPEADECDGRCYNDAKIVLTTAFSEIERALGK